MRLAGIEVTGQHRRYERATPDPCAGVPALSAARLPSVSQGISVVPDQRDCRYGAPADPGLHRQASPPGWQLCSQRVLPRHAAGKELAPASEPAAAGRSRASIVSAARAGDLACPGRPAGASRRRQATTSSIRRSCFSPPRQPIFISTAGRSIRRPAAMRTRSGYRSRTSIIDRACRASFHGREARSSPRQSSACQKPARATNAMPATIRRFATGCKPQARRQSCHCSAWATSLSGHP